MPRSKRYLEVAKKIDSNKLHTIAEAIPLLKETSTTKFKGSVELHVKLGISLEKSDQQVRGTVSLPHGSGKASIVAVFAEGDATKEAKAAGADIVGGQELIDEIKKTGKIAFDVAVATPEMMKNLAQIAKVLGPKGLMPSPKNETVTKDVKETVEELKKGKQAFKNDATGNVHMIVGKTDFEDAKLIQNIETAIEAIKKAKPSSSKGTYLNNISVNATMGPGIKVTTA